MRWLVFALALAQSTIGSAAIFGLDDRTEVSARTAEGRAVGYAMYGTRRTTAFLVDGCFAVTSQHLVSMSANPLGERVGLTIGRFRVAARVVRAGHMERGRYGYADDWLLLQLDRCRRNGPVVDLADEVAARPDLMLQSSFQLTAVGFPIDRDRLVADPDCRIRILKSVGLLNDCAAQPGSSGSPLLARQGRRLIAYAIQSGALPTQSAEAFTPERANIATPVAAVRQALQEERWRLAMDLRAKRRGDVRMASRAPDPVAMQTTIASATVATVALR